MKKYIVKYKWPLVIFFICLVIVLGRNLLSKQASLSVVPNTQTVQVQKVGKENKVPALELSGSIEAHNSSVISSKFGGKIKIIPVDNGTKVEPGQVLLFMEDVQQQNGVLAARSALEKAKANLVNVQKTFEQTEELLKAEVVSQNDYDKAKLALDVATADVGAATAAFSNAEEVLRDTRIVSSLNGFVADRRMKEGQVVAAGTPLMTVQDISSVYIVVKVNQEFISQVKPDQSAEIVVEAYSGQKFQGKVELINPVADSTTRTFEVKIAVQNPDSLLKPGMYAKATLALGAPLQVISVPQTAVSGKEGLYYVFLAVENTAKRQAVEIGETMGKNIEIKSGLEEGQQLITSNVNKLKDGDPIQITDQL
ncbi:MAG: efflux RND transporter periplasmic adaptor subunit [Peptococcaceae bacterium]|nr:efflux RND transporter periplasmic adaptor subunit [Peptococcaceae bacterium]